MDTRAFLKETLNRRTDRSRPVHFSGRLHELDVILSRAEHAQSGAAGSTVVIQGAPGAGKSALLDEAARRFEAAGADRKAIYMGAPWKRAGESLVLERLAREAFAEDEGSFRTTQTLAKGASVSAKVANGTRSQTVATPTVELADWVGYENRYAGRAREAARTVILVDECQTFEKDAGSLLRALHTQNQFPFLLVCGGLSHTAEHLASLGISRLGDDALVDLGQLSIEEARESALQTLAWTLRNAADPPIRHTESQIERWADQLSSESLGWPQHLASYMAGAWHALSDTTNLELSEANLGTALDQGRRLCSAYYANRLQAAKTDPRVALAVHVELADTGTQDKAYEAIKNAVGKLPEAARASHEYNHPGGSMDCLTAMLKAGVVSRSPDGIRIRSPTPTMTDYLAQAARLIGATSASSGRLDT